ncbi:hypothetical protein SSS_02022 [Sarcoptes scabiei]|nr:hypothetical protein SSS_02022 [Sarcoptes scabiei]
MFKDDGTVIHFNNPKVQAALSSNTFAITGQAENKKVTDMMPGILNQMRPDNLNRLNNLAELLANTVAREQGGDANSAANGLEKLDKMEKNLDEDDDVPQLVQNFDEAAKINENVN